MTAFRDGSSIYPAASHEPVGLGVNKRLFATVVHREERTILVRRGKLGQGARSGLGARRQIENHFRNGHATTLSERGNRPNWNVAV